MQPFAERGRLKRRQANEWAACVSLEKKPIPVLKGFSARKAALPESDKASQGRPAGWVASGTVEEDGPVTRETPARPRGRGPAETWAKGVGLRPGGKLVGHMPPNPTAARAASTLRMVEEG